MAQVVTPNLGNIAQGAGQNDFVFGAEADLAGHASFNGGLANGDTVYYIAMHMQKREWEIGLGTWTASTKTLARTTVKRSSAGGTTKATFSGGNIEVKSLPIAVGSQTYTLTNTGGAGARTFDGNQATAATISATVSRLIADLQEIGLLK